MTFDEALKEYKRQYEQQAASRKDKTVATASINYSQIDDMLIQAAKDEYGFNNDQAAYVYLVAYERWHAHYGDLVACMSGLCHEFKTFANIKS